MIETVDFAALFASPLSEAAARAFERGLSDQLADRLTPQAGPERREQIVAIKTRIRRPWEVGDLPRFVGMALALHRIRALNAGYVRRLAWALLTQDRFEEAVPLFALCEEDDHLRWWDEARALAGAGGLAEAAQAAAVCGERLAAAPPEPDLPMAVRALERRPSHLDLGAGWPAARADIRALLKAGRTAEAAASLRSFLQRRTVLLAEAVQAAAEDGTGSWPRLRRRAGACLLLGLGARAADLLAAGGPAGAELPAGALEEAAPLFAAAAAAAPAQQQGALLQAFVRFAGAGKPRRFAELALKALAGEATASETLRAPRPPGPVIQPVATMLAQGGRPDLAVTYLGELSTGKRRQAPRLELAVCQSRETAARLALRTEPRPGPRRIFDLFPYNGELERLRIKLHEMGPWVDGFVLVESASTFSGQPKPLRFDETARAELAPFLGRISHVVVDRFPDQVTSPWARELYQRDQAAIALQGLCGPDDLVILSDVDEVVDQRAIEGFEGDIAPMTMSTFRFFLNYRSLGPQGRTAALCRASLLEQWGSSLLRMVLAPRLWSRRIMDAGWHFSSVGDAEDIARKLESYSHQENNRPDGEAHYRGLLERIRGGELEAGWERCGLEVLPACVGENRERYARLLL